MVVDRCSDNQNSDAKAINDNPEEMSKVAAPSRSFDRPMTDGASARPICAGTDIWPIRAPYPDGRNSASGSVPRTIVSIPFPAP
jgi:hypothetical protein